MKTFVAALMSGLGLVLIVLLVAFIYVWLFPEGGDGWDAKYFFTHPAFFILFTVGAALGVVWQRLRRGQTQN